MVIESETRIKKWAGKLTTKELEVVTLTLDALFDFADLSSNENEKQEIELSAFTSKLLSVKDALHWAKEISELLSVPPFLVREIPAVISSVPYHNSKNNRIYTRTTKKFFIELRELSVVLRGILSSKLKKDEVAIKKSILLHTNKGEQRVCLENEQPPCYPIRGESPQRFKIIHILYQTKNGKTVREIMSLLNKDEPTKAEQNNLKREIKEINKQFKACLDLRDDLIDIGKSGYKNIYFLNRKRFNFNTKK